MTDRVTIVATGLDGGEANDPSRLVMGMIALLLVAFLVYLIWALWPVTPYPSITIDVPVSATSVPR